MNRCVGKQRTAVGNLPYPLPVLFERGCRMAHQDGLPVNAGPSKFDLMASLFDGKVVKFTIGPEEVDVMITGVAREDGSLDSWIINGFIPKDSQERKICGWYSTKRRAGQLSCS